MNSRNTDDNRTRVLMAAQEAFSTKGFEGVSLREIASNANVMHQLVVYHFKTKDGLWRAVMEFLLAQLRDYRTRSGDLKHLPPGAALRLGVRSFVQFTAHCPQFHRIWSLEAQSDSPRSRWLIETYVKPQFESSIRLIRAAQQAGSARSGDPARLHYGFIGLVTTTFVFSREVRDVAGIDPFLPEEIDAVDRLAADFFGLTPGTERAAG